ncbi:MAG: hypothetical protein KAS99_04805 [Candidatus Omnitrophica bacterium]|nr:hypothetical protein [Candidatus Omnitrophota bacterium]
MSKITVERNMKKKGINKEARNTGELYKGLLYKELSEKIIGAVRDKNPS